MGLSVRSRQTYLAPLELRSRKPKTFVSYRPQRDVDRLHGRPKPPAGQMGLFNRSLALMEGVQALPTK